MKTWAHRAAGDVHRRRHAAATPYYDVIAALQNLRAGRTDEALPLLTRAIALRALKEGELADALEWRAFLHAARRDLRAARADLDAAIQAESENPLRHRARARFLMRGGDFRAALADMDVVMVRSSTGRREPHRSWCEILLALGRRADATERCQRAITVDPEYARGKAMLRRAGRRGEGGV